MESRTSFCESGTIFSSSPRNFKTAIAKFDSVQQTSCSLPQTSASRDISKRTSSRSFLCGSVSPVDSKFSKPCAKKSTTIHEHQKKCDGNKAPAPKKAFIATREGPCTKI